MALEMAGTMWGQHKPITDTEELWCCLQHYEDLLHGPLRVVWAGWGLVTLGQDQLTLGLY